MANDRMYIRCKGCGELHYLAKCYDDGYFTTHEGEELRQGLDDFFDRHKWCYRDKYYGGFELVYESDELTESEDERIMKTIRQLLETARDAHSNTSLAQPYIDALAWLEKQKEQKPAEWSEEDEEMLDAMVDMVANSLYEPLCPRDKMYYWLKSLRPQPHWKPSEEQMKALEAATVRYQSTGLESLYEDLKKL